MFDNAPKFLGCIREKPVFCTGKHLEAWNKDNEKIYDISGPCCPVSCGGEISFQVKYIIKNNCSCIMCLITLINLFKINSFCSFPKILDVESGMDVGLISKQWMGFLTEALTDKDTFRVNFPSNATLETKAILLGATMLVVS